MGRDDQSRERERVHVHDTMNVILDQCMGPAYASDEGRTLCLGLTLQVRAV